MTNTAVKFLKGAIDPDGSVLITDEYRALLAFFAVMWTHVSGRIDDVQAAGSERVDAVHSTLREISETLGRLDQRTRKIDDINAKLDRLLESVIELKAASHTHTAPDIQSRPC